MALELESDFGRAEFLRDRLIPKAVLYFTGEALEEDDENDEVNVVLEWEGRRETGGKECCPGMKVLLNSFLVHGMHWKDIFN